MVPKQTIKRTNNTISNSIIMNNLSLICWITFLLLLWFESDILKTIFKAFPNIFKFKEFNEYASNDPFATYPEILYILHPSLLTKLLSCPFCLCFWLTLLSLSWSSNILILLPIHYICSFLLYLITKKLMT